MAKIIYNGTTTEVESGKAATLVCGGKKMKSDIVLEIDPTSGGGDLSINGVVNQYRVEKGESVNAGDFVSFVTKFGKGDFTGSDASWTAACRLGANKVLVVYRDKTNSNYGTAVVFTLNGTSIEVGNTFIFKSANVSNCQLVALSDTRAFLTYRDNGNNSYGTAVILTVNGTTISKGTEVIYEANAVSCNTMARLSENKVMVAFLSANGSTCTPKTVAIGIDGDTITVGTSKTLSWVYKNNDLTYIYKLVALSKTTAAFFCRSDDDNLRVWMLTINDLTIETVTTDKMSITCQSFLEAALVGDGKVLVNWQGHDNSGYNDAFVAMFVFSGATILSKTEAVKINVSGDILGTGGGIARLTNDKAIICNICDCTDGKGGSVNAERLTTSIVTITGDTFTVSDRNVIIPAIRLFPPILIPFNETSALSIFNHGTGSFIGLSIDGTTVTGQSNTNTTNGIFVKKATSSIFGMGVAKTSGASEDLVEVYCPTA